MPTTMAATGLLPPAERRARLLARHAVDLVIDVGANEGQYATRLRRAGFEGTIVSFEPGSSAFARLAENAEADANWHCHHMALGDHDGTAVLNIAEDTEGSSLLQVEEREVRNSPGSRFVDTEPADIRTLDTVLPEGEASARRLYLKLDTQGSELAILRGAPRTLLRAAFVESELSLVGLYRDGPLFQDIVTFLDDRGFALISIEGIDEERDTGHMLQVDAIFHRSRSDA